MTETWTSDAGGSADRTATADGSWMAWTAGGIAGYAFAYYIEPPPEASLFVSSGVLFGTAIGSMYGYGAGFDIWYGQR